MAIPDRSPTALTQHWRQDIPLLAAMGFQVTAWDGHTLTTSAPLIHNLNDKRTGFAGSIAALASVTGWGLTMLVSETLGQPCQAAIRDSQQSFHKPVTEDLQAQVTVTDADAALFLKTLEQYGKARLSLTVDVGTHSDTACARLKGTYVAWRTTGG